MEEQKILPPLSVYRKLHEIQKRIKGLGKNSSGGQFKYTNGDKVIGEIKPAMNELGLLLIPNVVDSTETRHDFKVTRKDYDNNGAVTIRLEDKAEILVRLTIHFTWVCVETGQELVVPFRSMGFNGWDKGLGSALTYGERYFLLKFFHIATDADDIDNPISREEERFQMYENQIINCQYTEQLKQIAESMTKDDRAMFDNMIKQQYRLIQNKQQQVQQQNFNNNQNQ